MVVVLALGASVLWGSADFGGGVLSRQRSALAVTVASQALAALILVFIAGTQGGLASSVSYLPAGVLSGALGSVGIIAFYKGLAAGPMGLVAAVASTAVLVPVVAGIAGGEHCGPVQGAGIAFAVVGIAVASCPESARRGGSWRVGGPLAVVAALGFGGSMWAMASAAGSPVSTVLATQRVTSAVMGAVLMLACRSRYGLGRREIPSLAFVGTADVAANGAYIMAATAGAMSEVSVLASLYPLVTAGLACGLLRERLHPIQLAGAATTLGGVLLLALGT